MALLDLIRERRELLVERWVELVLATYPSQAVTFLQKEKDGFRNPVGATIRRAIGELAGGLLAEADAGDLAAPLEAMVRMRAVQSFSPAQAVGFVFLFRRALREVLKDELREARAEELLDVDARLDGLALMAWDSYATCREKVSDLRAREATARTYALLKRAGFLADAADAVETAGIGTCSRAEGRS